MEVEEYEELVQRVAELQEWLKTHYADRFGMVFEALPEALSFRLSGKVTLWEEFLKTHPHRESD